MSKVLLSLAEGFEEMEAVNLIDVMRRGGINVIVASVYGQSSVMGAHGISVGVDSALETCYEEAFDMIVLPGGLKGVEAMMQSPLLMQLIRQQHEKEKLLAAICAAPLALKQEGLLPSRYTCYPGIAQELNQEGYDKERKVVIENNILTSQGPSTAICLGLEIVKELEGEAVSDEVKQAILAEGICL